MKCPNCGYAEMTTRTQDKKLSFGGQALTLHEMKGEFCFKCDKGITMMSLVPQDPNFAGKQFR